MTLKLRTLACGSGKCLQVDVQERERPMKSGAEKSNKALARLATGFRRQTLLGA